MTRPLVRIYTANGEFIDREMNDTEWEQAQKDEAQHLAIQQAKAEAAAKRQALLDRLGITEEEAKLLLS